jgi:uncharacterized protein YukE
MPELLVIPSELERAAGRLQASADQVRSVVGTLLPAVGGVGAALGDAALADRFRTLWSRWASELGVLADDLTGAAGRLQAAAAEYRTTDQAAVPRPPATPADSTPDPGPDPRPGPGPPWPAPLPPGAGPPVREGSQPARERPWVVHSPSPGPGRTRGPGARGCRLGVPRSGDDRRASSA